MSASTTDFEQLVDLASERLGGAVLHASDDFFAEKENLVKDKAPVWDAERYTDRGKWMDGWESRRRRTPGHDWCLIRLGMPGVIRGVVIDTSFFRGNYPESCWIEGTVAPSLAGVDELLAADREWIEILPRTALAGDTKNNRDVTVPWRFTHLRFHIDPDGGVARLRIYGEVVAEPALVAGPGGGGAPGSLVDLAALELGGSMIAASDMFFGDRHHLNLPGGSRGMHDGWETRRRRGPGHDWVIVRLAAEGVIERAIVDTSHFKGNAPGSCTLEIAHASGAALERLGAADFPWQPLLPMTALEPDREHAFELAASATGRSATHACLRIHPDGGVARLRLFGRVNEAARRSLMLRVAECAPAQARRAGVRCLPGRPDAGRVPSRRLARSRTRRRSRQPPIARWSRSASPTGTRRSRRTRQLVSRGPTREAGRRPSSRARRAPIGQRRIGSGTPTALMRSASAGSSSPARPGRARRPCLWRSGAACRMTRPTERAIAREEVKKITRLRLEKLVRS